MTIIMTGVAEFQRALDGMVERASAAAQRAVTSGGHLIEAEAKRRLGLLSHARGTRTPSAPGEPPALVTGTLRRSIKVTRPEPKGPTGWTISVGPTAVYGRIQELGGYTGAYDSYLPPRPFMEPAFRAVVENGGLREIFATAWRTAF